MGSISGAFPFARTKSRPLWQDDVTAVLSDIVKVNDVLRRQVGNLSHWGGGFPRHFIGHIEWMVGWVHYGLPDFSLVSADSDVSWGPKVEAA